MFVSKSPQLKIDGSLLGSKLIWCARITKYIHLSWVYEQGQSFNDCFGKSICLVGATFRNYASMSLEMIFTLVSAHVQWLADSEKIDSRNCVVIDLGVFSGARKLWYLSV